MNNFNEQILKIVVLLGWMTTCSLTLLEGKLLGDHVCQSEITVPQETLQWELKNRTTRTYKWCLSVPPRCSVYSNSVVNETRVTVINVTKLIEVCCEGYTEQNNFCISLCQDCQNGLCIRGTCMCQSGWNGPRCDTRATSTINTSTKSISGSSILGTTISDIFEISNVHIPIGTTLKGAGPSLTTTSYIEGQVENAMSSRQSNYNISEVTDIDNRLSPIADFNYRSSSIVPATTRSNIDVAENHTIWATSRKTNFHTSSITDTPSLLLNEDHEYLGSKSTSTTESSYFDTTLTEPIHIPSPEEKLVKNMELMTPSIETVESSLDYREADRDIFRDLSAESNSRVMENWNTVERTDTKLITTLTPQTVLTKPSMNEHFEIEENIRGNALEKSEERFEKRFSIEKLSKNPQLTLSEPTSKNLIYSVCAASLTTVVILVVVITLYAVRNSREKVEKHRSKKDVASVAVYTTSIFHSPLPDPPMFDNPTYLATRTNRNSWSQDQRESVEIQELNVVFEKPVANTKLDSKQYFYDHPPSTGSYRASSDIDTFSHYNLSQKSMSGIVMEPVYDEIPSKPCSITEECDFSNENRSDVESRVKRNADSNCLYMNTCGRTEF